MSSLKHSILEFSSRQMQKILIFHCSLTHKYGALHFIMHAVAIGYHTISRIFISLANSQEGLEEMIGGQQCPDIQKCLPLQKIAFS